MDRDRCEGDVAGECLGKAKQGPDPPHCRTDGVEPAKKETIDAPHVLLYYAPLPVSGHIPCTIQPSETPRHPLGPPKHPTSTSPLPSAPGPSTTSATAPPLTSSASLDPASITTNALH